MPRKDAATSATKAKKKPARAAKKPAARPAKPRATTAATSANGDAGKGGQKLWELRLYVAGQTPKSMSALANLQRICDQHLPGQYRIEVVDLLKNPQLAQGDQIVAIPTLVRKLPEPIKRVIGDLSNLERVLVGMDIRSAV